MPIELKIIGASKPQSPEYEVNHLYLFRFCLILSISASVQLGLSSTENGLVGYVLKEKLGWSDQDYTNCTLLGPLGIAIGSLMASYLGPRIGIYKLLLAANGIAVFSNLIKVIETSLTVFIDRLLFSICTGAQNFCMSKAISETVPI